MSGLGLDGSARIGRLKRSRAESIIQSAKCASWRPKNRIKEATTVHAPCRSFSGTMRRWTRIGQGVGARELDRRGGRRGDVHGLLRGEIRGRRDPGREAAFDPREPGAGGDRGAGRTRRRGGCRLARCSGWRTEPRSRPTPSSSAAAGGWYCSRRPDSAISWRSAGRSGRTCTTSTGISPRPSCRASGASRWRSGSPRGGAWSGLSGTRRSPKR